MPGVLVELGYISTPDEENYLLTEAGTNALAKSIYQAFLSYKKQHTSISGRNKQPATNATSGTTPKPTNTAPKVTSNSTKTSKSKPVFKIQILTSDKKLNVKSKQFKGLSPVNYYQEKGLYKYTYNESTDYNKVLRIKKQIATKFKDAFIVAFKDGKKMDVNQAIKEFKNNK